MSRLINDELLKESIREKTLFVKWQKVLIEMVIDDQPTVDAVPVVHGRWDKGTDSYWHICEECGAEVDISMGTGVWVEGVELHELNYCPNCGARMDGEV